MNRFSLILTACLLLGICATVTAQSVVYKDTVPQLRVKYLYEAPKIDGRVDFDVSTLPVHLFGVIERSDSTSPIQDVTYRIGYGADFLYLYLEAPQKSISYRDRGYQNGDGIIVVIATPHEEHKPADEFYVLGFTPQKDTNQSWQRAFVWYHDVGLEMKPLRGARFGFLESGGKVTYEILIPWSSLYPYHPWLATPIGFNLCYSQAIGDSDRTYYMVVPDERIQSEQSLRQSSPLTFDFPSGGLTRAAARLERNNITEGMAINAIVGFSADPGVEQDISFNISMPKRATCGGRLLTLTGTGHMDTSTVNIPTTGLVPADYTISWISGIDSGSFPFTVVPDFDEQATLKEIANFNSSISQASRATMTYQSEQIVAARKALKPYAPAGELKAQIVRLNYLVSEAVSGRDRLRIESGVLRRAFRSAVDSTLQPYSINVPANFDRSKSYPLVVFLHGSGQDDRSVLPNKIIPDSMFTLAPYGRGTSHMYSADHAQEDILEAIADVVATYPIDTSRIVIAGFSMGGYGAYRAFYEKPTRYRAVAIFSGHPDLANRWSGGTGEPNFLDSKFLAPFRDREMFIFHGGQDRNCPVELTRKLVSGLKSAGAKVDFVLEPDAGHQYPATASVQKFRSWLAKVLAH